MTSATPWPAGPAQRYCSQECRRGGAGAGIPRAGLPGLCRIGHHGRPGAARPADRHPACRPVGWAIPGGGCGHGAPPAPSGRRGGLSHRHDLAYHQALVDVLPANRQKGGCWVKIIPRHCWMPQDYRRATISLPKDIVAHLLSGKRRTRDTQKGVKDGKPTYGCSTNCFARASYALAGV